MILKLQKEKQKLIREKDIIYTERLIDSGEKNRLIKEQIALIEKKKRLAREMDAIDTFRLKETFDKNQLQTELKERDEIIKELEKEKKIILLDKQTIQYNLLNEKYEKESLRKDQKQLQEKYNILNEKYEQLKQEERNFINLKKRGD
jgi:hypothetical protein